MNPLTTTTRLAVWILGGIAALPTSLPVVSVLERLVNDLTRIVRGFVEIERRLAHVAESTSVLPSVEAEIKRVAEAAEALPQLGADLEALPQSIDRLDKRVAELLEGIGHLLASVDQLGKTTAELAAATHPLHGAVERLESVSHGLSDAAQSRGPRRWLRGSQNPA